MEEGWKWKLAKYGMNRESLLQLKWKDFERFMDAFFPLEGYEVERRGGPQADGGIDLVVRKDGKKKIVQCKQWNMDQIGVDVVRGTLGARDLEEADGIIVATTGLFTEHAREIAEKRKNIIELIDGAEIANRLGDKQKEIIARCGEGILKEEVLSIVKFMREEIDKIEEVIRVHRCSKCGCRMVLAYSPKNRDRFWGCENYGSGKCSGETMPLDSFERDILGR